MKIGIVVPFSWSYWGGVVEHAENQAAALRDRGHDVQILMGHDPPGRLTRLLHPRTGRHGDLPDGIIPIGRSVVVPANGSLPNIVLSPRAMLRIRDTLTEERFDLVHLHEPMTPVVCVSTLAYVKCPVVATWHAAGDLGWMRGGLKVWGFLIDRIDARIAVSRSAAESAERWLGTGFEIVPNGVVVPETADPENRLHHVVFIGRHDTRKGLPVLLAVVARDPAAHGRPAPADRDGPAAVPAPALPHALRRGWNRRARDHPQRRTRPRAFDGQALRLARARRGELRDGARRGLRDGDPGGRLEHPGLRGRGRARRCDARSARATRRRLRTRWSRCSETTSAGSRWPGPGARLPWSATRGRTSHGGSTRSTSGLPREERPLADTRAVRADRARDLADLVARARLAPRPEDVRGRELALDRLRGRAQPRLGRRPGGCLEHRDP